MSPDPGAKLGRYEIRSKVIAGIGDVYLAEDTEIDRKFAFKILPPLPTSRALRRNLLDDQ